MNRVAGSLAVRGVRRLLGGIAIFAAFLLPVESAQAGATVLRFSDTHTETFIFEGFAFCIPEPLDVVATVTETSTVQIVDNGNVFTARGTNAFDEHFELPDGMYVQSGRIDRSHFAFVFNPPLTVFTSTDKFFATIYEADGTPVGKIMVHVNTHSTIRDVNGNGIPDPGEISVEFDNFRVNCL